MAENSNKTAILYRMALENHICPYGLKAKNLLEQKGYVIEEHLLTTRAETDAFKAEHQVKTTPQIFIAGNRIGGYDDLRNYLLQPVHHRDNPTFRPVIVIFAVAALMPLAVNYAVSEKIFTIRALEWFIEFSMVILAILKLQNLENFSTMFLNYDLLAQRWVPYSYIYPFAEAAAGLLMIANILKWIAIPLALFIGTVGAVSVLKAVYIDKRELKCACVGGDSNVPLGFISFVENLMMIGLALWMIITR